MARRDDNLQARLDRDMAELKLWEIANSYREVLDEAARKGSSMLEVLATLIGMEQAARQQRALQRRLRLARLRSAGVWPPNVRACKSSCENCRSRRNTLRARLRREEEAAALSSLQCLQSISHSSAEAFDAQVAGGDCRASMRVAQACGHGAG